MLTTYLVFGIIFIGIMTIAGCAIYTAIKLDK